MKTKSNTETKLNLPPKPTQITVENPHGRIIGRDLLAGKPIRESMPADKATARPWRFCIFSPSGTAQFLAKDEAEADSISKRLTGVGLKHEIKHMDTALERDFHGVKHLQMLAASKAEKQVNHYRYDWINGKALISFRGKCIAEANWIVGHTNPKEAAAVNGQLIADALNIYNPERVAALEQVAEELKMLSALLKQVNDIKTDAPVHIQIGRRITFADEALATLAAVQGGGK